MSNSLRPPGLYSPQNSPGQNTEVGNCYLLQGIIPIQGLNPGLPHCRHFLYQQNHKESHIGFIFKVESHFSSTSFRIFFLFWKFRIFFLLFSLSGTSIMNAFVFVLNIVLYFSEVNLFSFISLSFCLACTVSTDLSSCSLIIYSTSLNLLSHFIEY